MDSINDLLAAVAEMPIEDMEVDELNDAWLTADDIASRIRDRMIECKRWWAT
jgi:hypothetical protein